MIQPFSPQPDAAVFEELAYRALDHLPARFREYLGDVVIRIEEFADREALEAVGLDDRWELTGLYHGRPLGEQSIWSSGEMPPMILLYRAPLLRECRETGVDLADLITHVVVHEVGHHFGLSDDDMHRIEEEE
ncbi:MAG TPA: metallopeptidase family protein [Novosphingobium sp.]